MSFDTMAKTVHELIQKQNNGDREIFESEVFRRVNQCEQEAIINGFSKVRSTGDSMVIEIGPNVHWA